MSVFEDLIGELKNENLLEDTILDLRGADAAAPASEPAAAVPPPAPAASTADPFGVDVPNIEKPADDKEFYRKRAMEEVTSLQMVEHVFGGIEREHLQVSRVPFDDLNTKKALHKFLQVSVDPKSREHAEAEFALRQETEAWNLALYDRDKNIAVSSIRRFCEESRPVLSSQALISLARFYRNSPYSEDVRGKFDYVMTRLFSRETDDAMRQLLFEYDAMLGHINTLYSNWSSIALYTQEEDQTDIQLTATRVDEFRAEVENASTFDALLKSHFFNRVRNYKEETAEMFFVPEVMAAAIRCNLAIGNKYVTLIARERNRRSAEKVEARYGEAYDSVVSDAAGKTLTLSEVLAVDIDPSELEAEPPPPGSVPAFIPSTRVETKEPKRERKSALLGVNRWVAAVCLLFVLVGVGVYVWADNVDQGSGEAMMAQAVEFSDAELKKYLRSPRSTNDTLFAMTEPAFETLNETERKELISKAWQFAQSQKLQKVTLLGKNGQSVAFATNDRIELIK